MCTLTRLSVLAMAWVSSVGRVKVTFDFSSMVFLSIELQLEAGGHFEMLEMEGNIFLAASKGFIVHQSQNHPFGQLASNQLIFVEILPSSWNVMGCDLDSAQRINVNLTYIKLGFGQFKLTVSSTNQVQINRASNQV